MALRVLGIDLGSHSVKVAELRSSFRSLEVVGLSQAPVSAAGVVPTLAEQVASATQILPVGGKVDVVVVGLPGVGFAAHRLGFPFADTKRLEQTLGFEVEGQIPFDLSEVTYDYEVVSQVAGSRGVTARTEVLVGVARKTGITELVSALVPAGLDPRIITLPGLGLHQIPTTSQTLPGPAEALIDLGHNRVNVLVREGNRASFARVIDGGGRLLTAAIARARGLDLPAAETLKLQSSVVRGDPELQQLLVRTLLPMVREIRQTLKQVEGMAKAPVERAWLTGGTALLHGLPELLQRELGVEVRQLAVPGLPGTQVSPQDFETGALALGLALRGHGGARAGRFNFRRGDQSFQGDFARVRGRVLRTAALAGVLAMCFAVRAYAELYLLGKREGQIDEAICAQTKQTVGKCIKDTMMARSALSAAGGAGTTVIPDQSAVALLAETANRMNIDGATLNELDVGLEQIQLRGTADSFETVDQVVAGLKGYHCFTDVQRGRVQKSRDASEIEFTLSVHNDCAGGGS